MANLFIIANPASKVFLYLQHSAIPKPKADKIIVIRSMQDFRGRDGGNYFVHSEPSDMLQILQRIFTLNTRHPGSFKELSESEFIFHAKLK